MMGRNEERKRVRGSWSWGITKTEVYDVREKYMLVTWPGAFNPDHPSNMSELKIKKLFFFLISFFQESQDRYQWIQPALNPDTGILLPCHQPLIIDAIPDHKPPFEGCKRGHDIGVSLPSIHR